MTRLAYLRKIARDPMRNQDIQAARDATICTCGHPNIAHGFGYPNGRHWPDGSMIGMGECGHTDVVPEHPSVTFTCDCRAFEDAEGES